MINVGFSFLAKLGVEKLLTSTPAMFDQTLMAVASELNKTCPIMIDAQTRFDNALAFPGNIFQYNYTLINYEKGSIDTLELKKVLQTAIVNNARTNPQMAFFRERKTTLNFYYKDMNGEYVFMITVTPDQYLYDPGNLKSI